MSSRAKIQFATSWQVAGKQDLLNVEVLRSIEPQNSRQL